MRAQPANARRIGIGFLAVCAALLTASCAAGQHAASAEQVPAIDGTTVQIGSMQVHALALTAPSGPSYPVGSDVALTFVVVNTGSSDDTLTSVTSTAFTSAALYKDAADATAAVPSAGAGGSTTGTSAAPTPITSGLTVTAGNAQPCGLTADQPVWLLSGLISGPTGTTASPAPLFPAATVPITFTFTHAGTLTVPVPVQLRPSENDATLPQLSGSPAE